MKLHMTVLIALLLIIFTVPVSAESFVLKDLNTNEAITDVIVYANIGNKSAVFPEAEYLDLEIDAEDIVELIADNPSTPGIDYYSSFTLADISEGVIYLNPAATLKGIVKDTLDNVMSDAELKCECSEISSRCPASTDQFGSFNMNIIGTGHCKIYANYKDAVGFVSLDLGKGDLKDVEIKLDKTILKDIPKRSSFILYAALAIVIFALVIFFTQFRFRKRSKRKETKEKKEAKEEKKVSKRSQDIMQTLNKKEKEIVEFLMSNDNKSYQAKIRHTLGIPRTSLSRLLESLQRKKVVDIQKEGKAVRIKLTDWFMDKG